MGGCQIDGAFLGPCYNTELAWKWRWAPYKTTIHCIGPYVGFHVNLGEGKELNLDCQNRGVFTHIDIHRYSK